VEHYHLIFKYKMITNRMKNLETDLSTPEFINGDSFRKCEILLEKLMPLIKERSTPLHTRLLLDGYKSYNNVTIDSIESMSRTVVFLASFLYADKYPISVEMREKTTQILFSFFINAADERSEEFWGYPVDRDQRIVEMADYALALWMVKDSIWKKYQSNEKKIILSWLNSVNGKTYVDNNWHLFPLLIDEIILSLNGVHLVDKGRFQRIASFCNSDGWFRDGSDGEYDFYNAWGFYYSLYWLTQINPKDYEEFYKKNLNMFAGQYKYLIGNDGFPFLGRSACYKYAVSVPLILASVACVGHISYGHALRGFNCIWRKYAAYEVNKNNLLSQGFFGTQPELLDAYSGPGSSLWSLRSCIVLISNYNLFQGVQEEMLNIEKENYDLLINEGRFHIVGNRNNSIITLYKIGVSNKFFRLKPYIWKERLMAFLKQKSHRPNNSNEYAKLNKVDSVNEVLKLNKADT